MATGTVARFDCRRGYGFVVPDDGGEDVFVHQNNILMDGFRYLRAGERISYELEVGEKGMKAVQVQLLEPRREENDRAPRDRSMRPRRNGPGGGRDGQRDGQRDKVRRRLERLVNLLVEKKVLEPGELDRVEQDMEQAGRAFGDKPASDEPAARADAEAKAEEATEPADGS